MGGPKGGKEHTNSASLHGTAFEFIQVFSNFHKMTFPQ